LITSEERRHWKLSEHERQAVRRAFEQTSEQGWGLAFGSVAALGLFVATIWLVVKGGPVVGPHLGLLSAYLPGYSVTWPGAFIGGAYLFFLGYGTGRVIATIYNRIVRSNWRPSL
jgi:hypothetical protein